MIERIVIGMVISFVLRQLEKFKDTVDWSKVKADLSERVAALIPGTWFDTEAVAAVHSIIDAIACALEQTDAFKEIMELVAAQKWSEAGARLKVLLMAVWDGDNCPVATSEKAKELVAADETYVDEADVA